MQVSVEIPVEAEAAAIAREVVLGALEEFSITESIGSRTSSCSRARS